MVLSKKEKLALDGIDSPEDFDQDAPYRDIAGRTLTEIHESETGRKSGFAPGLMCYDNTCAELMAKNADPRYTEYNNHDNPYQTPREVAARKGFKTW